MTGLHLRPVTAGDDGFLRALYAATREQEIAATGWDATLAERFLRMQFDAQHGFYHQQHPNAQFDVVVFDGEAVGRLYVARSAECLLVLDIALLPAWRGRGLGSCLLQDLQEQARRGGKRVTLHVDLENRALAWYRRLGFQEKGVAGFHRFMEWVPGTVAAAPESNT